MSPFRDKHIFISALGSRGDIHPLLGIATELHARGARITFAVSDYYRETIEKYGFGFIPTGSRENFIEFHNDARIWKTGTDVAELGWAQTIRPAIEKSFAAVENAVAIGDDVIVLGIQPLFNGAFLAADVLNLPVVNFTLAPQYIQSILAPPAPLKWMVPKWIPQRSKFVRHVYKKTYTNALNKDYFWQYNGMRRAKGLKPIKDYSMDTVCSDQYLQVSLYWTAPR